MTSGCDLPRDEYILQLMADRATEGLSRRGARELNNYLKENSSVDRDALEYAAAAVYLAFGGGQGEPMPVRVRDRVLSRIAR